VPLCRQVGGSIFAELGFNPNDDTAVDDSNIGSRFIGKISSGSLRGETTIDSTRQARVLGEYLYQVGYYYMLQ
jgi:hypothetical protein